MQDIDLSRVITLHTKQSFNETLKFSNVNLEGFIEIQGQVNGKDLMLEYNNTLMASLFQAFQAKLKNFNSNFSFFFLLLDLWPATC